MRVHRGDVDVVIGEAARQLGDDAGAVDADRLESPAPGVRTRGVRNRLAFERMVSAGADFVDVRPASEALGLEKGTFLHAGPPIEFERASGPLKGALIGAMLFEGLADNAEEAVAKHPLAAVLGAFVLGVAIGRLTGRG